MRPYCQTCARRWGKSLWENSCVCSGHVKLGYRGPDPLVPRKTVIPVVVKEEERESGKRISKKELARIERALGKPIGPSSAL